MKAFSVILASLGVCVVFVILSGTAGHAGAQSVTPRAGQRDATLGAPAQAPILTRDGALTAAQAIFDSSLFTHPFAVDYGSFVSDLRVRDAGSGDWVPVGKRDVWKITVTGLNLPSPGGRRPGSTAPVLYMHTLVIFIDDKTGEYLQATSF